jgi:cell division protein FtsB
MSSTWAPDVRRGHGTVGLRGRAESLGARRAVILFVVLCILGLTLAMPVRTYLSQRAQADQLATEHTQLVEQIDKLEKQKTMQSDPEYVRAQARLRLQYVNPGETPYRVQVPGALAPTPEQAEAAAAKQNPWYTNVWRQVAVPH